MKVTRFCPAKVNLFLEVTGKRPNGYHELATLFAKINIGDTLTVDAQPQPETKISLTLTGPIGSMLKADPTNLAWRAARIFLEHFHLTARVDMVLDKHTPTGAGLGGGSSDAAGVLLALCEIFKKDKTELLPAAAKLGADVPLFMYEDTFLKGEGIGEKLTPVPSPAVLPWAVLVYPDTAVPTKGVFARLALPDSPSVLTSLSNLDKLIMYIRQGLSPAQWQPLLFNRLEEAVLPYISSVRNVKECFSALGASPLMSGSGSTVFAVTTDRNQADDLADKVKQKGRKVFTVRFGGNRDENN